MYFQIKNTFKKHHILKYQMCIKFKCDHQSELQLYFKIFCSTSSSIY